MCRSIKTLHNFAPPATDAEVRASALQFVRKLSGFAHPSKANEPAFNRAVDEVLEAHLKVSDRFRGIRHSCSSDPDPAVLGPLADARAVAVLDHQLGVDRPLPVRYWEWISRFVVGDMGMSYIYRAPVAPLPVMATPPPAAPERMSVPLSD